MDVTLEELEEPESNEPGWKPKPSSLDSAVPSSLLDTVGDEDEDVLAAAAVRTSVVFASEARRLARVILVGRPPDCGCCCCSLIPP